MAGSARGLACRRYANWDRGSVRSKRPVASRLPLCAALIGVIAGGCSLSYQLGSFLGNGEDKPAPAADAARPPETAVAEAGEENLGPARAAVVDALAKNGTAKSSAWENAATGARGTITPITVAAKEDSCRDFLASYVHGGSETWLEGEACRGRGGRWEVRRLAPWKRT